MFFGNRFVKRYFINFSYFKARVGKVLGQFTIIGEQQYTGGITVETAYRENAFICCIFYDIQHGFAAFIIICRGNKILRLIQQYVDHLLAGLSFFTIKNHFIRG